MGADAEASLLSVIRERLRGGVRVPIEIPDLEFDCFSLLRDADSASDSVDDASIELLAVELTETCTVFESVLVLEATMVNMDTVDDISEVIVDDPDEDIADTDINLLPDGVSDESLVSDCV